MVGTFLLAVTLCLGVANAQLPLYPLNLIPLIGNLWTLLASGVTVTMLNSNASSISIGLVTVPLEYLCTTLPHSTCRLCYIDCIVAHNASYSSGCGGIAGGNECICEYTPGNPTPTIDATCGNYEANILGLSAVNAAIDAALVTLLRARYQTILCNPLLLPEPTCNIECINNHWAVSGTCVGYVSGDNSLTFGYCICGY